MLAIVGRQSRAAAFLYFALSTRASSALMSTTSGAAASAAASANSDGKVNLFELASAAVACTVAAGRTIQHISQPRDQSDKAADDGGGGGGEEGDDTSRKNTRLKTDGTFVTDADFAAQGIIVQALHSVSPDIRIMGEESQEDMERHIGEYEFLNDEILQKTRRELLLRRRRDDSTTVTKTTTTPTPPLAPIHGDSQLEQDKEDVVVLTEQDLKELIVDASRVCCIVDPLDGTRSYAHGEYDCVSILIAILVDHEPYFGVIGKPFGYTGFSSILDTSCATIYGGPLTKGTFVAGGDQIIASLTNSAGSVDDADSSSSSSLPKAVISTSRSKGVVHDFCVHLGEKGLISPEPLLVSGAGEKSLRLIVRKNHEAIWFFPKPGTYLWDVAAPDAILRSLGGKLTNKFGKSMDYSKSRDEAENTEGVVACIDSDLHAECIRLFQEGDWVSQS